MKKTSLIKTAFAATALAVSGCVDPVSSPSEPNRPLVPFNTVEHPQQPVQVLSEFPTHNLPEGAVKVAEVNVFSMNYEGENIKGVGWFPVYAVPGSEMGRILFPDGSVARVVDWKDSCRRQDWLGANPLSTGEHDPYIGFDSCRLVSVSTLENPRTIPGNGRKMIF